MVLMESHFNLKELETFKYSIKLFKRKFCNEVILNLINICKIIFKNLIKSNLLYLISIY